MGATPDRQYGRELATEPEVDAKVAAHRDATLLHDLDRAGNLEVIRDAGGRVQFVRTKDGPSGPVIRETEVTRAISGRVATVVDRQFEPPGTVARTRTTEFARDAGNRVTGATITVAGG